MAETYFNGTWVYSDAPDNDIASWEEWMRAAGFTKAHEKVGCCFDEDFKPGVDRHGVKRDPTIRPMNSKDLMQRFRTFQEGDVVWLREGLSEKHVARLCKNCREPAVFVEYCKDLRQRLHAMKSNKSKSD